MNNKRKGVEHRVPKITNRGSIGPKSPSISPSKNPKMAVRKIWAKKNKITTEESIEKIVFHGDDFCER
tara:strand:- start:221 stop:424 length:204 start_codon:yes stop_codon:yes gene_type:complete